MRYFVSLVWLVLAACTSYGQPFYEWSGNWIGHSHITVDWCEQDTLSFDLQITTDGDLTGNIGDAVIKSGSIEAVEGQPNSYVIYAKLRGSLIECEAIKRTVIYINLSKKGDVATGDFYTEGRSLGKKESGVLTGNDLMLVYK